MSAPAAVHLYIGDSLPHDLIMFEEEMEDNNIPMKSSNEIVSKKRLRSDFFESLNSVDDDDHDNISSACESELSSSTTIVLTTREPLFGCDIPSKKPRLLFDDCDEEELDYRFNDDEISILNSQKSSCSYFSDLDQSLIVVESSAGSAKKSNSTSLDESLPVGEPLSAEECAMLGLPFNEDGDLYVTGELSLSQRTDDILRDTLQDAADSEKLALRKAARPLDWMMRRSHSLSSSGSSPIDAIVID